MSFAANKFPRNQRRILQESSKLNLPASKNNVLNEKNKASTDGIIPAKPVSTHSEASVVGEQSIISQQVSLSIASLSSTEAILKRSLKNVPRAALPVRQTLTSKLRQQKANPLLQARAAPTLGPLSASTPLQRRATFQASSRPAPPPHPPPTTQQPQRRPVGVAQSEARPPRLSRLSRPPAPVPARRPQKENRLPLTTAPSRAMPPPPPPSKAKKSLLPPQQAPPPRLQPTKPKAPAAGDSSGKPPTSSSWKGPKRTAVAVTKPAVQQKAKSTPVKPPAAAAVTPQPKSILRRRSKSADNVNTVDGDRNGLSVASKSMNKSLKSVVFYSPLHAAFPSPKITNTPPPSVLRKRLEDWLKKRGKSNYSYHHLCCFGLHSNVNTAQGLKSDEESPLDGTITLEESSPNVEAPIVEEEDELLSAPQGSSTPEKPQLENDDKEAADDMMVHPGALHDLQQLIHSGYPRDQCEQWLALIVRSHPAAKEEFLYWECLAALEEARGDLGGAVDCLGRAIEQGADAAVVDARLDALWERFCALGNAPPTPSGRRTPTRRRAVDPKHIFKSTVIRFALQRKAAGKRRRSGGAGGSSSISGAAAAAAATGGVTAAAVLEESGGGAGRVRYVVTPVRRSARRSTSAFRSSEGLPCVASLRDLSPSVQKDMSFQGNALLDPNT